MKVTNIKKLWIKFIGGGLINFPHENLREVEIDGDGLDGGGGGQEEEIDEVKTYLDELATKVKSSENYSSSYEIALTSFTPKEFIEEEGEAGFEDIINLFKEQGKVKGNTNNYDYVYSERDDDKPETPSALVFITEEQFNYFQKSIIKASAKDFITSSLMIDNLTMVFGENISGENDIKNKLAIGKEDFKFAIGQEINDTMVYTVLDDIDMIYFANLFPYRSDEQLILFDENETRKIFDVVVTPLSENANNKYNYLKVQKESTNYIEDTIQIWNKNYKYLKYDDSIAS